MKLHTNYTVNNKTLRLETSTYNDIDLLVVKLNKRSVTLRLDLVKQRGLVKALAIKRRYKETSQAQFNMIGSCLHIISTIQRRQSA